MCFLKSEHEYFKGTVSSPVPVEVTDSSCSSYTVFRGGRVSEMDEME